MPTVPDPSLHVRKRIVLLVASLEYGGTERQVTTLANVLDRQKYAVTVLCIRPFGTLRAELLPHVQAVSLKSSRSASPATLLWHLPRYLRRLRPDLIQSFLLTSNLAALMGKLCLPHTRILWGIRNGRQYFNEHQEEFTRKEHILFELQRHLSPLPAGIVYNAHSSAQYYQSCGYHSSTAHVVPNGIDTERFRPDRSAGAPLRERWGIPADGTVIGVAGRWVPSKNYPCFLKAAAILVERHPQWRFVCIGSGSGAYRLELQALARQFRLADRVIWEEYNPDPVAFYNALDLYCSSSLSEGFSNTIAEAMACGVPCAVTGAGDSALIVGDTGRTVPCDDHRALADACEDLFARVPPPVNHACRARIIHHFSVDALAARMSQIYESVFTGQALSGEASI